MAQSLSLLLCHIIFSTKNRERYLTLKISAGLYPYMAVVLRNIECGAIQIGGTSDHVHVFCTLSKTLSVSDTIKEIKIATSKWLKTKGPELKAFRWKNGYGAFSVSPSNKDKVQRYIIHQDEHHRKMSFQEEFRRFLKEYGIPYEEDYVWG